MNYLGDITLEPGEKELFRTPVITNARLVLLLYLSGVLTLTTKRAIFFGEEPDVFGRKDTAVRANLSIPYENIQEIRKYSKGGLTEPKIELVYTKENGEQTSVYFSIVFDGTFKNRRSTPYMKLSRNREEARATFLLLKQMVEDKDFRKGVLNGNITTIGKYSIPHLRDLEDLQIVPVNWKKSLLQLLAVAIIASAIVVVWKMYIRP